MFEVSIEWYLCATPVLLQYGKPFFQFLIISHNADEINLRSLFHDVNRAGCIATPVVRLLTTVNASLSLRAPSPLTTESRFTLLQAKRQGQKKKTTQSRGFFAFSLFHRVCI